MPAILLGPYSTAPAERRRHGKLVMWAEDGFVYCIWDDGEKNVLEISEAKERLAVVAGEVDIWLARKDNGGPGIDRAYAREMYDHLRRHMEHLRDTIQDAVRQGDSTDPKVRYEKMKAFLRAKRAGMGGASTDSLVNSLVFPVDYGRPVPLTAPATPTRKGWLEIE